MRLQDKVFAVTGGAAGIGAAVRERLLAEGADVVVLDRVDPQDPRVTFIEVDLADPSSIAAAVDQLPAKVDGLANVAGVPGTKSADAVMRVNYLGLRALSEAVEANIQQGGSIVNVASAAGASWQFHRAELDEFIALNDYDAQLAWSTQNAPQDGPTAYGFSKEAVIFYSKQRSHVLWTQGVRINCVCPGATATGILTDFKESMPPGAIDWSEQLLGRHAAPEDVASVVVFLLGPDSGFVNGADIPVDGGLIAGASTGGISVQADA